jgi:hypothetical protein
VFPNLVSSQKSSCLAIAYFQKATPKEFILLFLQDFQKGGPKLCLYLKQRLGDRVNSENVLYEGLRIRGEDVG